MKKTTKKTKRTCSPHLCKECHQELPKRAKEKKPDLVVCKECYEKLPRKEMRTITSGGYHLYMCIDCIIKFGKYHVIDQVWGARIPQYRWR